MAYDLVVVGLGYVGLPLAEQALARGLSTAGFDVNRAVVDNLNSGTSHVDDLTDDAVAQMVVAGFVATADPAVFAGARTIVICVPTPLSADGGPDLGAVTNASRSIAAHLQPGTLVVLESTTYPGTTDEIVRTILEEGSGLETGKDYHLAFSPERIDPGNAVFGVSNTPKVVGGCTPACSQRAEEFYRAFVDTVVVAKGTREAETAKLLENTYRHVNIALVNEMARFCHELDIDLWDVIRLAETKPFGFQAFRPGPGVGGHCIPIDPNYLGHRVRSQLGYAFRFVELAQEINAGMPAYVAQRVLELLNADGITLKGANVLLLGVTYKADIADQRESPAVPLAQRLRALGANVSYHDPHVTHWDAFPEADKEQRDLEKAVGDYALVILVQGHTAYDVDGLAGRSQRFFDTRGTTSAPNAQRL